jgi:hypothetical protein
MQKQRIVEVEHVEDQIIAFRRLQNDLARAFAADAGWSVKRTVIVGCVFHGVVLGSLALAASNLVPHIAR